MKLSVLLRGLFLLPFFQVVASASATHTASIAIDLVQVVESGAEHVFKSTNGDFFLDWNTGKCEIQLSNKKFLYCNLDTSQDIINSKGELVMKSLPQARFEGDVMDGFIRSTGLVANPVSVFKLPFYTCENCEKNGKDLKLLNAYQSAVSRELAIICPGLDDAKKTILRMKITKMKAIKGAFDIDGNSNNTN